MKHEFTVGQVLSNSFSLFFKNFGFMIVLGLLASLPATSATLWPDNWLIFFGGNLFGLVSSLLLQGIVVFAVFQGLSGQKVDFAESLSIALRRALPLLGVSLASSFIIGLGTLFLVIPGVVFYTMFWVSAPICIVERIGVGDALQRSGFLTSGYRMGIFLITLVVGLMMMVLGLVQAGIQLFLVSSGTVEMGFSLGGLIFVFLSALVSGFSIAFNAVVVTVGYYTLRHEVEGVAVKDLESVFE
ncbi:MAG: hypothetical protein GY780_05800 [bacterium]|nr:hypothetical protein [bacterium]